MQGYTLQAYYQLIFELSYFHKYSISELEDLPYFELEVYRDLIADHIKREHEEANRLR